LLKNSEKNSKDKGLKKNSYVLREDMTLYSEAPLNNGIDVINYTVHQSGNKLQENLLAVLNGSWVMDNFQFASGGIAVSWPAVLPREISESWPTFVIGSVSGSWPTIIIRSVSGSWSTVLIRSVSGSWPTVFTRLISGS
jgi:hypothetical protein